jgi:hypothetical protein
MLTSVVCLYLLQLREDFVLIAKELFEESKTTRNPAM